MNGCILRYALVTMAFGDGSSDFRAHSRCKHGEIYCDVGNFFIREIDFEMTTYFVLDFEALSPATHLWNFFKKSLLFHGSFWIVTPVLSIEIAVFDSELFKCSIGVRGKDQAKRQVA